MKYQAGWVTRLSKHQTGQIIKLYGISVLLLPMVLTAEPSLQLSIGSVWPPGIQWPLVMCCMGLSDTKAPAGPDSSESPVHAHPSSTECEQAAQHLDCFVSNRPLRVLCLVWHGFISTQAAWSMQPPLQIHPLVSTDTLHDTQS